jgi:6-phosphogluconolactonase
VLAADDLDDLAASAADLIIATATAAVDARGRFTMALAGGRTPEPVYARLAVDERMRRVWPLTTLFFGDERCVPPSDPESNYRMADGALLARVPGLAARTHRIEGERPAADASARYEAVLRAAFPGGGPGRGATFDLVLLGMGPDGHTASLFPGGAALAEGTRWAVAAEAPPSMATRERVTLTIPALASARDVVFLCAGADKRPVLTAVLGEAERADSPYPAARVTARERLIWVVERSALP